MVEHYGEFVEFSSGSLLLLIQMTLQNAASRIRQSPPSGKDLRTASDDGDDGLCENVRWLGTLEWSMEPN